MPGRELSQHLLAKLDAWGCADSRHLIGFSGGADSTALLIAAAEVLPRAKLRALHVDHAIHPDAGSWAERCAEIASGLGVDFDVTPAVVAAGPNLEERARELRYAAFRKQLRTDEILLTAHHAHDQTETIFLALLRGAGLSGLRGMREMRIFPPGFHGRPLLDIDPGLLRQICEQYGCRPIKDPMNEDIVYRRSWLRKEILPALRAQVVALDRLCARAAANLEESEAAFAWLLEEQFPSGQPLPLAALERAPAMARLSLLRGWLAEQGLQPPPKSQLAAFAEQALTAQEDRNPQLELEGFCVRRYQGALHLVRADSFPANWSAAWDARSPLHLPDGSVLSVEPPMADPVTLQVRLRQGGESIVLRGQHRSLKKLLQEHAIAPWRRASLPLVYHGDDLWAVGALMRSDACADWLQTHNARLRHVGRRVLLPG